MEDFFWIFILLAFWVFEIVTKAIKKQQGTNADQPKLSRPDPQASRRELARDVDDGARKAEDALRSWEANQLKAQAQAQARPVPSASAVPQRRRTRAADRRREAFEAIATMLAPVPVEPEKPATPKSLFPVDQPRRETRVPAAELPPPPSVRAREQGGFRNLAHLSEIQRAIVLSEILGSPVGFPGPGESRPGVL